MFKDLLLVLIGGVESNSLEERIKRPFLLLETHMVCA